ncbi:MAG: sensor histidine kinase [Sphingomonadaceae bacterium]|nr:sensor histidine kinase [Sphingomonadaceae bacterium]
MAMPIPTIRRMFTPKMLARALLCVLLLVSGAVLHARDIVILQGGQFETDIMAADAASAFDPTHQLSAEDMRQRPTAFRPIAGKYIDFGTYGENRNTIWVAVDIRNGTPVRQEWIVSLHRSFVQDVRFYLAERGSKPVQPLLSARWGEVEVAGAKPVGPFLAAPFALDPGQEATLLVALRNNHSLALPLEIATQEAYQHSIAQRDLVNYLASGAWLAMIILILVMGPAIGWRVTLAFVAYQLFAICTIMGAELYLFRWEWMDIGVIYFTDILFYMLVVLSMTIFAQAFFETRRNFPIAHKVILVWQVLFVIVAPYVAVNHPDPDSTGLIIPFVRPVLPMLIYIAIHGIRTGLVGSWPVLFGLLTILTVGAVDSYEKANPGAVHHDTILELGHMGFLVEGLLFAIAILYRFIRLRHDHEASLEAALAASQEKLRLSHELAASRERFERARTEAQQNRIKVASMGHDLRQPLAALRSAFERRTSEADDSARQVEAAFGFLEGLAASSDQFSADDHSSDVDGIEIFAASVVLGTTKQMFGIDAVAAGIELRTVECGHAIRCNPVIALRIASNLVSNGIRHSGASRIVVGYRHHGDTLVLQVWDNGRGMHEDEVRRMMAPGAKAADSTGNGLGLGLHIVHTLCAEQGFALDIASQPGRGTRFSVALPRA